MKEGSRSIYMSFGNPSAVAAGFPCCCDITTALSDPLTLATGTHCTASVSLFDLSIYSRLDKPSHRNITSN